MLAILLAVSVTAPFIYRATPIIRVLQNRLQVDLTRLTAAGRSKYMSKLDEPQMMGEVDANY